MGMKLPLVNPPESSGSPGDSSGRRVRQYHPELLNKAVQLVIEKGMSLSNVSEVMGIPMTTLWRKVKAKDPSAVGAGRGGGDQEVDRDVEKVEVIRTHHHQVHQGADLVHLCHRDIHLLSGTLI